MSEAEALFSTEFYTWTHLTWKRHPLIRQFGSYSLPPAIESKVEFVSGVADFPMPRPSSNKRGPKAAVAKERQLSESSEQVT